VHYKIWLLGRLLLLLLLILMFIGYTGISKHITLHQL